MFGSSILEVAIGVIFIYLFLSLLCTTINEAISSLINKRGKNLFDGVKNLLNDPEFTGLAQQVYNHGLIDGISQGAADANKPNRLPSYMPASSFSLALLDILGANGIVAAAHGPQLSEAERADDAYDLAKKAADAHPSDGQLKDAAAQAQMAQKNARAALESAASAAQIAYEQAVQAAGIKPGDLDLNKASVQAKNAVEIARAAISVQDARRAAVASAKNPKDAELIKCAADTLEDALAVGRALAAQHLDPLENIRAAVDRLPNGHTKETLLVLIFKTKREVNAIEFQADALQKNLENWFNDAMDRVGGWYKRWTQKILLGLAFFIVFAVNADTVMLVQRLTMDSALRTSLVTAAQDVARTAPPMNSSAVASYSNEAVQPAEDPRMKLVLGKAESLKLPLGWSLNPNDPGHIPLGMHSMEAIVWFFSKLFGLLVSVFAVSLGAPFWFDTLSKFINLRSAGTPPGETKKST